MFTDYRVKSEYIGKKNIKIKMKKEGKLHDR